jgi:poly(3-hydroxybutyrate) depolymerase
MALNERLRSLWQRLRNWLAARLARWRGRWHTFEVEVNVARWTWWPLPFSHARWDCALYCPAGLADDDEAPLLVLLHGCGQEAMAFAHAAGWVAAADATSAATASTAGTAAPAAAGTAPRGRFRLLCPQQALRASPWRCWNWFHPPAQNGQGELQVVLQALQVARSRVRCGKVAALGLSAGGGLAALLAFHHPSHFDAVVTVAAPPLLGRGNLQDPRRVMREGLAVSPTLAALHVPGCAPLLLLHGTDDEVVHPRCAEQLAEQARHVLRRSQGPLIETALGTAHDWHAGEQLVLRSSLLPGMGHTWSGAPGGHPHVSAEGPPITGLALDFLQEVGLWQRPAVAETAGHQIDVPA